MLIFGAQFALDSIKVTNACVSFVWQNALKALEDNF
jgi:hypothetical protein